MIWAAEEDREAASAIRDSASLSEMKDSEKMTSYCGRSARCKHSGTFWVTHLRICQQIISNAEDMRAAID